MYVAINRLKVKPGAGPQLIERFSASHGLEQVPGFLRFRLLEPVWSPGQEDLREYLSMSEWDSRESFEAWLKSDAFRNAHKNGDTSIMDGPADVTGYEPRVDRAAAPAPEGALPGRTLGSWLLVLVLALGGTLGLAGCEESTNANESTPGAPAESTSEASPQQGITFTDDVGRTVHLEAPAERVVAGASYAVGLLMALDHPPVLRPDVPEHRIAPPSAKTIPTFAVEHGSGPDVEAIAMAKPDLVLLHVNFAPFAANIEQALGVPVALLEITSVDDVARKLRLLGKVLGAPEVAEKRVAELQQQVDAAVAGVPDEGPRVLGLFGTPDAFYAYRGSSYLGSMFDLLGATNVAADKTALTGMQSVAPLNMEEVVATQPEVIVITPHGPPDVILKSLAAHPAWSKVDAVRHGRVHILDEALFSSNPGPQAPEALTALKALLYPASP